jgi:hypothetical protein
MILLDPTTGRHVTIDLTPRATPHRSGRDGPRAPDLPPPGHVGSPLRLSSQERDMRGDRDREFSPKGLSNPEELPSL